MEPVLDKMASDLGGPPKKSACRSEEVCREIQAIRYVGHKEQEETGAAREHLRASPLQWCGQQRGAPSRWILI
jgi:hypothetical protein